MASSTKLRASSQLLTKSSWGPGWLTSARRVTGRDQLPRGDTWHTCSHLGRAQNAGLTESVPLWSTGEPEPERFRLGKCVQPRARFRQFPCRATWSLSSVDWESIHAVTRGKPSVAQTLRALPTHTSDICLQFSSLPTAQLNK